MQRRQHGRVQDANDQELAVRGDPVEYGVLADERAQVRRDLNKRPAELGPIDERLEPSEEPDKVAFSLIITPSVCCERANVEQVNACPAEQSETRPCSASTRGTELGEDALKARVLRDPTLLTFDQRGADRLHLEGPVHTDIAVEAFDQLMSNACPLIGRQGKRFFQDSCGVRHGWSLSRWGGTCQSRQPAAGRSAASATRTSIGTVKPVVSFVLRFRGIHRKLRVALRAHTRARDHRQRVIGSRLW